MCVVDLQQNKRFLNFDNEARLFTYAIPSHTCVVLQFNENTGFYYDLFVENIKPTYNHVIFREDTAYLYPSTSQQQFQEIQNVLKNKEISGYWKGSFYDRLLLRYAHWKSIKILLTLHGWLHIVEKPKLHRGNCFASLNITAINVPLTLVTTATVFPSVNEKCFNFVSDWQPYSPSWVSSKLYHINCSLNQREISHSLGLAINSAFEICHFENVVNIQKWNISTCLHSPHLYTESALTILILSLSFSPASIKMMNSSLGSLVVSNLWKSFCGDKEYVRHLADLNIERVNKLWFGSYALKNWTNPIECAELSITYHIHSNFFSINNEYNIELQVSTFRYAELHFLQRFVKLAIEKNIIGFYRWQREEHNEDYLKLTINYKIVFSIRNLSWFDARRVCFSYNMTLPTFSTKTHLKKVLSHISAKHGFQLVSMFTGIFLHVRRFYTEDVQYRSIYIYIFERLIYI